MDLPVLDMRLWALGIPARFKDDPIYIIGVIGTEKPTIVYYKSESGKISFQTELEAFEVQH